MQVLASKIVKQNKAYTLAMKYGRNFDMMTSELFQNVLISLSICRILSNWNH
ncbi:hypothetical protein GW12_28030 [Acinetobacter sp. HR7]|nr:hypothetical protein GW12_28030 [Acinetobacter sp. HR7]